MPVFCGIDWAEGHHDVALVDADGRLVGKRRINETPEGFAELTAMLTTAGDSPGAPIPVAIETPRGLLVAALRAAGRVVYAINPLAVARYRERTSVSGKKSDHLDAMTLANILRTDAQRHRRLPADTSLARSVTVLARAYQDAVWRRTKLVQELRARLREYYPGFLTAFGTGSGAGSGMSTTQLAGSDARAVLAIAPDPAAGVAVSKARIETALRRGGRQRRAATMAASVATALRVPQLRQESLVESAMATETLEPLLATETGGVGAATPSRRAGLKVDFEITTLGGEAGRQLAARQAAAIRAALIWLAQNPPVDPLDRTGPVRGGLSAPSAHCLRSGDRGVAVAGVDRRV